MALTHLRSARLHALAEDRGVPEAVKIYDGTAARLTAEVQKIIATLEKYRSSKASRRRSTRGLEAELIADDRAKREDVHS